MKVIIALVVQYAAKDWADEHGIAETEAFNDFVAALRRTVHDGGIPETLDKNWPMMRGHITAHMVDGLDATTRDELLHLLREARDADPDGALITEITGHLAAHPQDLDGREPRWVVFHTWEWDNGHFLTGSEATVYFTDGDNAPISFTGSSVDDRLTDMYGARGAMAALGVDLREGTLEFDDYGENVPDLLGIPTSEHSEGDGCAIYATDYTVNRDGCRRCPSPTSAPVTCSSTTTTRRGARPASVVTGTTSTWTSHRRTRADAASPTATADTFCQTNTERVDPRGCRCACPPTAQAARSAPAAIPPEPKHERWPRRAPRPASARPELD